MHTCEDAIEELTKSNYKLEKSDVNLIYSLARQTSKGIAYTDRQYELAKNKILFYKEQLENNGYNAISIDMCIESLRFPVRQIDRSRWVKVVNHQGPNRIYESDKSPFIAVRFIFQKKLISSIDAIKRSLGDGDYDAKEKTHYFPFTEKNVECILSVFNEKNNFEIQPELKEFYNKIQEMKNNKEKYVPGIYGFKIKNLNNKSFDYAISSIGEPSTDNLYKFYDQKSKLGLGHFDDTDLTNSLKNLTTLSKKIVMRNSSNVFVSTKKYSINEIAESILELNRFPLLVVLNQSRCYDELVGFHKAFNGIIPSESCSVLFRLPNDQEGAEFNHYIHTNNLNNPVDSDTKIVYISNSKVPKPLLKSGWEFSSVISTTSARSYASKSEPYMSTSDLVIYYDETISQMMRFQRDGIEEL